MPLLDLGTFGGLSMYGESIIERENDIIVYSDACAQEHGQALGRKVGDPPLFAILPGKLRKDGFVSLASGIGMGEMTTDSVFLRSPELALNLRAPFGGVKVQISDNQCNPLPGYSFDDCEGIKGDHIAVSPVWKERKDLTEAMKNKWVRIGIRMDQAEIFSISGDFGVNEFAGEPGNDYL
jgi:hypothetical protein